MTAPLDLSEEMGLSSCLVFVCVLQPLLVHCSNSLVTCGSALKLQHVKTNVRLHSHEVNYGSGSGQQVGTASFTSLLFV